MKIRDENDIDFSHVCEMMREMDIAPGSDNFKYSFYDRSNPMNPADKVVTVLFLICVAIAIEVGLTYLLGWWWVGFNFGLIVVGAILIIKYKIKDNRRIKAWGRQMQEKHGIPADHAELYYRKNRHKIIFEEWPND